MRKAYRDHAKARGDTLNALNKGQYRSAARRALWRSIQAEKAARIQEHKNNSLNSLNPEKAARIQALRDAWIRTK